MRSLRTLLPVLVTAPALLVPSLASAQGAAGTPDPDLRIVAPAPFAPCYSLTKKPTSLRDRATIPRISLTGGEPGASFTLSSQGNTSGQTLEGGAETPRFDANGNATVIDYVIDLFNGSGLPGPARTFDLTVFTDAPTGSTRTPVGSFSAAAGYGIVVGGRGPTRAGQKVPVRVSGVPFANKDLYLFLTDARSGKQISRVKLGRADKCGFLTGGAVVIPKRHRGLLPKVWVNAGPKLDKKKALQNTDS